MQTLVLVLILLVCFNFMLKQTYSKRWVVATVSIICALFIGMAWPYAIEQSKTQIANWLANPSLMLDTSVILSIEVCIQLSFCIFAVHMMTGGVAKPHTLWTYRLLRLFPGLLIFPVLFSGLVALIFSFPGASFSALAWGMAVCVLVLIPVGTILLRHLLPEKELRLELLFLTNALTAILGIVATVNGRTAMKGTTEVEWSAFFGLLCLVATGGLAGMLMRKYKMNKLKNKPIKKSKTL